MKILLVGPVYPYRGGIAHYTAILAQKMIQYGHDVQVVSFRRQYPSWLYPGKTDRDPSKQSITTTAGYILDPLYPWTWLQAANEITRFHPDFVLVMWWSTFWAPADWVMVNLLRSRGMRIVYLIHNVLPHELRFYDRWLARLALNAARNFVVQTTQQAERLRGLVPNAHITQAVHPVYDMFEGQKLDKREARKRLNLPEDEPVLLFFGIVRPYKGLAHLFEAIDLLKRRGRCVHLLVAGEFWESEAEYRQKAESAGIANQVHITNRYIQNEEVPAYFSAADIFVAPYVAGTQSGAINIALSFGLPIVMTENIAESISETARANWKVVPPGDAASLADAVDWQLAQQGENRLSTEDFEQTWQDLIALIIRAAMEGEA